MGIRPENTNVQAAQLNRDGYLKTAEDICRDYGCHYVATTLRKSYSASRNGWAAMLYDAEADTAVFSREYDIQIVDRVGGGDSFAAGLIYALGNQMDNQRSIDFAVAASCLKQTIEGDFNRSTVAEVESLMKTGGSARIVR